jgi:hypothetical protein
MRNFKRFAWFAAALVIASTGSGEAQGISNSVVVWDWDLTGEDDGEFKTFDGMTSLTDATLAAGANREVEMFMFPVIDNPNPVTGADGVAAQVLPVFLQAFQGSLDIDKSVMIINRFRWDADLSDDALINPTGGVTGPPLVNPEDPEKGFLLFFSRDQDGETAFGHPLPYGYMGTMRLNAQVAIGTTDEVVFPMEGLFLSGEAASDTVSIGSAISPALVSSASTPEPGASVTVRLTRFAGAIRINSAIDEGMVDWTVARTSGSGTVSVEGQTGLTFSKSITEPSIVITTTGSAEVGVSASIGETEATATSVVYQAANPVELASFGGEFAEERVLLNWTTASQTNNAGWRILRSEDGENYEAVGTMVEGAGTTDELLNYSFTDNGVPQADKVFYMLEQIDLDGTVHLSNPVEILLGARFQEIPTEFGINAYPNPFNPSTTISYDLPSDELVSIVIYDVIGQEVRRLIDDQKTAGRYSIQWDARDNGGRSVATGVYIAKIEAGTFSQSQKMLLLK